MALVGVELETLVSDCQRTGLSEFAHKTRKSPSALLVCGELK